MTLCDIAVAPSADVRRAEIVIAGLAVPQNLRRCHDGLATQPHVTFESLPVRRARQGNLTPRSTPAIARTTQRALRRTDSTKVPGHHS
jgi:hypothetical protein